MDAMSDSTTVLASAEDADDHIDQGIGEEARTCISPSDAAVDRASHSDYGSSSAKSSPDTSHLKNKPQQTVIEEEKLLGQNPRSAKRLKNVSADMEQRFCDALKRPDYQVKKLNLSIPDKIIVRASKTTDHVLVMGTVSFMLDPLPCPYAGQEAACQDFRACEPRLLKAHLQTKHDLRNVVLNFVCPCAGRFNGRQSCPVVRFDPGDIYMRKHLREDHRKYYEAVCAALVDAKAGEDPQIAQKRERFLRRARRRYFPGWTHDRNELFPSQIIPDRIVIRTEMGDVDGKQPGKREIKYICNIDPCQDHKIGGPQGSRQMHHHLVMQHASRFDLGTNFFHKCPAEEVCEEIVFAGDNQLEAHVHALHPELLGKEKKYSEAAQKNREALEDKIPCVRMGEALTNHLHTDKDKQLFMLRYTCPVETCGKAFMGAGESARKYMVWHVASAHQDVWNVAAEE
ncbi:uncharacterized protein LOC129602450 [Paramacrobiotus metropolitanus]|uniref:uncharacterized protein LOC129602450 n=1 Tax=Paramacrobiotus metropolitanus TaxID=2943436 RepID=UPI002445E2A6|nr:uncharacterized protein LOC129602450 [Paramacrobiotus metropolitanus]